MSLALLDTLTGLLLFASDAKPPPVTGYLQGGWEYVYACYVIVAVVLSAYTLSLWLRRRSQDEIKEP